MELLYTPQHGEAIKASLASSARIYPFWIRFWCLPVYAAVAFLLVVGGTFAANRLMPSIGPTVGLVVVGSAALLLWVICVRLVVRASRTMAERVVKRWHASKPTSFAMMSNALVWRSGASRVELGFEDIDEVFETNGLLVFVTGGTSMFVPSRAFDNPESGRAFLRSLLPHLTPDARIRSVNGNPKLAASG